MTVKYVLNDIQEHGIMYLRVATDYQSTKLFRIVVQYFHWKHGGLQSKLLEVKSTTNKASLTIANEVKETVTKMGLFEKCVSFTGDNCNPNFGSLTRSKKVQIMLVTPSSGMFLCCSNLSWNTWINGLVYFTNLNALIRCYCRKQPSGVEPCVKYLNQENISMDEAKLFDQYHSLCKYHSLEQMHCHITK